jgi:nicotinamidase-related amidase
VALSLATLLEPAVTAVLAMEAKRGSIGDLATQDYPLAIAAREMGAAATLGRLCTAARAAGARIVHCTSAFRADGAGSGYNAPLLGWGRRTNDTLLVGRPEADPALELGPEPADFVSQRLHGVAPFSGTEVDSILRNLGVKNVIVVGGSLNVGVLGACIEAVNLGYRVVIPRDGVVGVPKEYVDMLFEHTLRLLATITTVDAIVAQWRSLASRPRAGGDPV